MTSLLPGTRGLAGQFGARSGAGLPRRLRRCGARGGLLMMVSMQHRSILCALISLPLLSGCDPENARAKEAERLEYARSYLGDRKDISPEVARAILEGQVTIGMFPDEAIAAGGDAGTSLLRDPKWPAGTPDTDILNAQRFKPDASQIHIVFRNRTQFGTSKPVSFKVHFRNGQVSRIEELE